MIQVDIIDFTKEDKFNHIDLVMLQAKANYLRFLYEEGKALVDAKNRINWFGQIKFERFMLQNNSSPRPSGLTFNADRFSYPPFPFHVSIYYITPSFKAVKFETASLELLKKIKEEISVEFVGWKMKYGNITRSLIILRTGQLEDKLNTIIKWIELKTEPTE